MGLNEVKQEILRNAQKQAGSIIADANNEAKAIGDNAQVEIQEYRDKVEKNTTALISAMERKESAGVEFDLKKALLDKKKEIIERVFTNVLNDLVSASAKKKEDILKMLIAKAGKEIDVKLVYVNKADKPIVSKMNGLQCKEADIIGGVIAETADGTIRIDYSYEEILDAIKKDNLQQIALLLFGK